jgi:Ca-activated chloride channel family protein
VTGIGFAWPLALLALALVPLAAVGYVLLQRRRSRYALRFTNLELLAAVSDRTPSRVRRHLPALLVLLALAALLASFARPHAVVKVPKEQATVILTIDVSGSMAAEDVEPTRMDAARTAAKSFLDEVPDGFRIGIVGFSSTPYLAQSPTHDREDAAQAIDDLSVYGGTAMGDAIARSVDAAQDGDARIPAVVLLLSDGANTEGVLQPLDAADQARQRGVPVFTIALGTDDGFVDQVDPLGRRQRVPVPPDRETLQQVAERTDGEAFEAADADNLERVYEELGSRVGYDEEEREITLVFVAAGTLLLLAGGTLSALWLNRLP